MLFRGVPQAGKSQGYVQFQGFGVIERAEFVSQLDQKTQRAFSNVRYDFVVMSAVSEGEELDWSWINARRDPSVSLDECLLTGSRGLAMVGQARLDIAPEGPSDAVEAQNGQCRGPTTTRRIEGAQDSRFDYTTLRRPEAPV